MPKNPHQMKELTTQLSKAKAHRMTVKHELQQAQRSFDQADQAVTRLEELINSDDTGPRVTEHAVLRYLERVKGIDIKSVRREILSDTIIAGINAGATKLPLACGATAIIKAKNIVSITN